jgi:hypothetical protein
MEINHIRAQEAFFYIELLSASYEETRHKIMSSIHYTYIEKKPTIIMLNAYKPISFSIEDQVKKHFFIK